VDGVAAPPDLNLGRAVTLDGLGLVQALQGAVMALIQAPAALDRQPEQIHLLEQQPLRADRALEHRGEYHVRYQALAPDFLPGAFCLIAAQCREVDVGPARE
jgi:hypothetical protein